MQTYIALFRGINVSGQKKIKMAELKVQLEEAGYQNVVTYIQSGNVVFLYEEMDLVKLSQQMELLVEQHYGFHAPILILRPDTIEYTLNNNPFLPDQDPKRLYVTFLEEEPTTNRIETLKEVDYSPEAYHIDGTIVYFFSPSGYGRAKMNNNFFEKKLKVTATTRNWRTVNKLMELAKQNA